MTMYDLVEQFKGITVWKFSQRNREVSQKRAGVGGIGGICSALSASWINYHAHNDSLVKHLQPDGHGKLDELTLQSVIYLQRSFNNEEIHYFAVDTWLEMHGMVWSDLHITTSVSKDNEFGILTSLGKNYNCYDYVFFGKSKKRGAYHAVAVWIGGSDYIKGDACFFDPNYGEFWFEKKQDFFCFFLAYYQRQRMKLHIDIEDERSFIMNFTLSSSAL